MRFTIPLLILLLSAPAFAEQATPEPGYRYRVTGVAAGDVLNIRSQPGTPGAIVGTLPPGADGVIVTGVRQPVGDSQWWEIVHKGDDRDAGWVNARFLERSDVHAAPETGFPLGCVGTEPFWGLRIAGGEAHFSAPAADGIENRAWSASRWKSASGRPPAWAFGIGLEDELSPSPGWAAILRAGNFCTDGMSDNEYPYSMMMFTPAGKALAGCCRRAP